MKHGWRKRKEWGLVELVPPIGGASSTSPHIPQFFPCSIRVSSVAKSQTSVAKLLSPAEQARPPSRRAERQRAVPVRSLAARRRPSLWLRLWLSRRRDG